MNNTERNDRMKIDSFPLTASVSNTVTIGKDIYVIERHFSGERDVKEAVYTVVKNEAFRASNS